MTDVNDPNYGQTGPRPMLKEHEIKAYVDELGGTLVLGASTPEGIVWLEQTFPGGEWLEDEDGRPLYAPPLDAVGMVHLAARPEGGPPYDAATATGMYDRD